MTLNQVQEALQTIAVNHKQINSFGEGELYDIVTSGDINYPLMYVNLQDSQIGGRVETLTFNITLMDIVKGGRVNEDHVLSDMLEVAKDVLAQLNNPGYEWEFDIQNVTISPFTERFTDSVAGVNFNISLLLPFAFDRCSMPYVGNTYYTTTPTESTASSYRYSQLTIVSGSADGANATFVFSATPLQVYVNGQLKSDGVGCTISGTSVVFTDVPFSGDTVNAFGYV